MRRNIPFKSTQNFQDRKMAKWMGFFSNEHLEVLLIEDDETNNIDFNDLILCINQAYFHEYNIKITTIHAIYEGKIIDLTPKSITLKNSKVILFEEILNIELVEVI